MSSSVLASSRTPLYRATAVAVILLCVLFILLRNTSEETVAWRRVSSSLSSPSKQSSLDQALNRTLGFEKIFVINLPSRLDHKDTTSLAAELTGLDIEYIDGVTEVARKIWPPSPPDFEMQSGGWNALRAHLNVARHIVEKNITSALVMEDDVDWDVRIKSQMRQFAQASQLLLQPLRTEQGDQYLDPSHYRGSTSDPQPDDLSLESGPITESMISPYGDPDRWDVLWVGHCGARWPDPKEQPEIPLGRVVIPDDETVPESQHIDFEAGDDTLPSMYPNHTRVVHAGAGNTCSFAYALTLAGARALLYEFSVREITGAFDQMLPDVCVGRSGRKRRRCMTVQPQLFQHHRPVGPLSAWSDIDDHSKDDEALDQGGYRHKALTPNIRWSTKVNFPNLVSGQEGYTDQFPDGLPRPDIS